MKEEIDLTNKERTDEEILKDIRKIQKIELPWHYMWFNVDSTIKSTNAILYAAKILWISNPSIREKLQEYNNTLTKQNLENDKTVLQKQLNRI